MRRLTVTAAALTAGVMAFAMAPALANAESTTQTVKESDVARQAEDTAPTKKWVIYTRSAGQAEFKLGPETPPIGKGSLELRTPGGSDKVYAFNYDHVGKSLADINALRYSNYRSAGSAQQTTAINIQVDANGPSEAGGDTTLVFEPVYNTTQGTVQNNSWKTWDAYNEGEARWWSSNPIPGAPNRDTFVSWNTLIENNPNATIIGFGINQGSGNAELITSTDNLVFGTKDGEQTTYDFEPLPVRATNKDQCKNDGYKEFQTKYKNQGDCVSAVASNDKAKGNPGNDDFLTSLRKLLGLQ